MAPSWYELGVTSHSQEGPCDCPAHHPTPTAEPESTETELPTAECSPWTPSNLAGIALSRNLAYIDRENAFGQYPYAGPFRRRCAGRAPLCRRSQQRH